MAKDTQRLKDRLSTFTRIARISQVNASAGTVNLKWLDHLGGRNAVPITQSDGGDFSLPLVGDIVLCNTDRKDRVWISRYIPIGYAVKVTPSENGQLSFEGMLPPLNPGERIWTAAGGLGLDKRQGGAVMYMRDNGDIIISTFYGALFHISRDSNRIYQSSTIHQVDTEAGRSTFGTIMRKQDSDSGGKVLKVITDDGLPFDGDSNQALTELHVQIVETADNVPGTKGIDNPLLDIYLGTVVDIDGNSVIPVSPRSEGDVQYNSSGICLRVRIERDSVQLFQLDIDREGNVLTSVAGNIDTNIAKDILTLIAGNVTMKVLGDYLLHVPEAGKNITLGGTGNEQSVVLEKFLTNFSSHTHLGNMGAPTGPPIAPIIKLPADSSSNVISVTTKVE